MKPALLRLVPFVMLVASTAGGSPGLTPVFETDFDGYRVSGYDIFDETGAEAPIGFSSWGIPGEVTSQGMRLHLDIDVNGPTPSGNGDLAQRCEMSFERFIETPMYTRMDITTPR